MNLRFQRRIPTSRNGHINLSKSGASYTHRIGPLTINSRGHVTLRLGGGFSMRIL